MERNAKGQFVKGEGGNKATRINGGVAVEYQQRSVAAKKKAKTIAEYLRAYLGEDAGNGHTRGELLVMQAVKNHKDGKLTFKDLRDLSRILGEDMLTINTNAPISIAVSSSEVATALDKVLGAGGRPRNPEDGK